MDVYNFITTLFSMFSLLSRFPRSDFTIIIGTFSPRDQNYTQI